MSHPRPTAGKRAPEFVQSWVMVQIKASMCKLVLALSMSILGATLLVADLKGIEVRPKIIFGLPH